MRGQNEMKMRSLFMLFVVLFIAGIFFNAPPARAIIRDQTVSTVAEKDTYVNSYDPSSNYGGEDYTLAGFYATVDIVESYFYFTFSDKPNNYTKAEISLYCGGDSLIKNLSICLIEEHWDEYSMNWTNKPIKGSEITFLLINQTDIYKFDVTNYIEGRNNLSICVYIKNENYVDGNVVIVSREGFFTQESAPQLIWTYPENAEITITNPTASSIWLENNMYTIQWTSKGIIEDVKIQLFKGTTLIEDITFTYTDNDGEYIFQVSYMKNYNGTDYRIKITDYDDPNVYDYSDNFSINVGSGTITIDSPIGSDSWYVGSTHTIRWTTTGTIITVDIEIYKGDTLEYNLDDVSNNGFYAWEIDENSEPGIDWRVKVSNSDNSTQYDWSEYFEIKKRAGPAISGYNYYVIFSLIFIFSALAISRMKK